MDPNSGVKPSAPIPSDYMQSIGYAGAAQTPPPFMQPSTPVSSQSPGVYAAPISTQQQYASSSSTQDQFYPRTPSADARPDWQKQIVAEVNAAQAYNPPQQARNSSPQMDLPPVAPMQISQNPYQMVSFTPQVQSHAEVQQYQTTVPVPSQNWQQPVLEYGDNNRIPTGDIVIPLDDTPPNNRRWLGIAIVVLIFGSVLGGIGFGAYILGGKAGYTKATNEYKKELQEQALSQTEEEQNQEVEEPDIEFSLMQPEYKNETVSGTVGEQLQASDGFVLYVKDVERDFSVDQSTDERMERIKVNFLVGNAAETLSAKITNANFTLKTAAGDLITVDESVSEYEGKIDTLDLTPGSKGRVSVVFAIPAGASSLTFIRQQSYVSRSLGQTVVCSTEVTLDS